MIQVLKCRAKKSLVQVELEVGSTASSSNGLDSTAIVCFVVAVYQSRSRSVGLLQYTRGEVEARSRSAVQVEKVQSSFQHGNGRCTCPVHRGKESVHGGKERIHSGKKRIHSKGIECNSPFFNAWHRLTSWHNGSEDVALHSHTKRKGTYIEEQQVGGLSRLSLAR